MYRNRPGQTVRVLAFSKRAFFLDSVHVPMADPVVGIANTITLRLSKDGGSPVNAAMTNPAEMERGYYLFTLTQAETDAQTLDLYPHSTLNDVQVIAVDFDRQLVDQQDIVDSLAVIQNKTQWIGTVNVLPPGAIDKIMLLGTGTATTTVPVTSDGVLGPLVSGDDYKAVNNRALRWSVDAVALPASCHLGIWKNDGVALIVPGVPTFDAGIATLTFELERTHTELFLGRCHFSVEYRDDADHEITIMAGPVDFNKKYT
jgi:hypothetical protein